MEATPQLAVGTLVDGEYRVERALGSGGMGAVYVAEQVSTGKRRALKVMHPQLVTDPKSRLRFIEEARVGSRIASEHVVEVVGAGVDDATGMPYLAMELLDGEDLGRRIDRQGPLPPAEVREVFLQLGHALGAAHAQGVIHRDLKPENVFLAEAQRRGGGLTVKVLDFGIAMRLEASRTAATSTSAIGSPLYMAPEQATPGAPLRPATDVWALGLIAFRALTGKDYWQSANLEPFTLQGLLAEVLIHPIDAPSVRARALGAAPPPHGFDAWFARCVARDPAARFRDGGAAVEALDAVLAGTGAPPARMAATVPMASAPGVGFAQATPAPVATPAPASGPTAPLFGPPPGGAPPPPTMGWEPPARRSGAPVAVLGCLGAAGLFAAFALVLVIAAVKPDAPSPPRAAAASTGDLVVRTTPSSRVEIDGQPHGSTPLRVALSPGMHQVTLIDADGQAHREQVLVTAGRAVEIVRDLTQRRRSRQAAAPPPPPLPPPEPEPVVDVGPVEELPDRPSAAALRRAIGPVRGRIAQCMGANRGRVTLRVTFQSDGSVRRANAVGGGNMPDEVPRCIARAAQAMRVPPFASYEVTTQYPIEVNVR